MFEMLGTFSKFEREITHVRIVAGMDRVRSEIARNGKFVSKKTGVVRRRLNGAHQTTLERR